MEKNAMDYLLERIKKPDVAFGEKLRMLSNLLPRLNGMEETNALRLLLESALTTRPSYGDLYSLCEMSEHSEVLHDYLRAFFVQSPMDSRCIEMAQRLEGVISFRMAQNKSGVSSERLHQTIASYLLRTQN